MIKEYCASIQGKSHIRSHKPCQDAFFIQKAGDWRIAVVADGVGSARHAETGSSVAVKSCANFIRSNLPTDDPNPLAMLAVLRCAFNHALQSVKQVAASNRRPLNEYDTTLMAVIYNGIKCYYAYVGDGGIIGLCRDGRYMELATPQNIQGRIIPLRFGNAYWQVGECKEILSSVIIATDGLSDCFRAPELDTGFYVPLLMQFADPGCIEYLKKKVDVNIITEANAPSLSSYFCHATAHALQRCYGMNKKVVNLLVQSIAQNNTPYRILSSIEDDKTFVCLYNSRMPAQARDANFYREPDWKGLKRAEPAPAAIPKAHPSFGAAPMSRLYVPVTDSSCIIHQKDNIALHTPKLNREISNRKRSTK